MRVLVFGAGAIGSLLGGLLSARNEVTLIARPPHVDAIRRNGLRLEGIRKASLEVAAKTAVEGNEEPELILISTKCYDTLTAIEAVRPTVSHATILCSTQNGIGNYEALKEAFPKNPVLASTITLGAMLVEPGLVRWTGTGDILVGGTPADLASAGILGRALRTAGFQALGVPDIRGPLWLKAIVNAAINPLSALEGVPNGELLSRPELRARLQALTEECTKIARALKIPLPEKDTLAVVWRVAEKTAENRSSMLQSLERGHRTEIDAITGAFLAAAKRLGLEAPECQRVYEAIRQKEKDLGPR